ncbi:MAG TPA: crossover junction endodeoxyribonuclease RuvC [Steroidobacteraceae bacterium]|nr:crossover junction endodeoxyribonuclease RuvC [Steroidobacteraceae bacterium]
MRRRSRARRWALPPVRSVAGERVLPTAARILGLDPGSLVTGYAVIECTGGAATYLTSGSIRTSGENFPERLAQIFQSATQLAQEWQPHEVAVERVFMHRNADSALKLGQARGAALCGMFSGTARVFEYSPREVKQAVVGTGAAQKEQVQMMVKHLLKLSGEVKADAADALAIALCHANMRRMQNLLVGARQLAGVAR